MKIFSHLLACLVIGLALLPPLAAADVNVFAAASLTDVLQKIAANYAATSTDKISFNFAGSNVLARQIQQGAPADLFFSADEKQMDAVAKKGLLADDTRRDLLSNTLVIIIPKDGAVAKMLAPMNSNPTPTVLTAPSAKRLALADPLTVPAGVYSEAYLQKVGLWDQVKARVIPTENVRAALAAVESDNADIGMVYKTDALHSQRAQIICEITGRDAPKIVYAIALVKGSPHAAAAQKFLAYLESPAALAVFAHDGFLPSGG